MKTAVIQNVAQDGAMSFKQRANFVQNFYIKFLFNKNKWRLNSGTPEVIGN